MEARKHPKSSRSEKSFSQYLIESDIKPLVFVGKSMQYFGVRPVTGFLLGIAVTYGYALYEPLPYTVDTVGPRETESISVSGRVLTLENQPLGSFEVGVLDSRHGPFEDGNFSIRVPYKEKYDILVWTPGYGVFKFYGARDVVRKGDKYSLKDDLPAFPAHLGIVEGTVKDQDRRPVKGYVEVANRKVQIGPDGKFRLNDIPLGKFKIKVLEKATGPLLREEDIDVQLTGPTPQMSIVITRNDQ